MSARTDGAFSYLGLTLYEYNGVSITAPTSRSCGLIGSNLVAVDNGDTGK